MSKVSSLEINLELNIECPHCGENNDVRENDCEIDYFWSRIAINRLNGKYDINESHTCYKCKKEIMVSHFEIF